MKNLKLFLILALASTMFSSCATIFCGTKQHITIDANVTATVKVNGNVVGTTPIKVNVKRSAPPVITVEAEGYAPATIQPETSFNAVTVLNLLNILFWGIDFATGSAYKYDPIYYRAELKLIIPKP